MNYKPIDPNYLASTITVSPQDIKDFLARPYAEQTGVISSTDGPSTFTVINVFNSLTFDIYKQKIKGHLGIRATQVFRLQINANRFQQGRYIMFWVPMGGGGGGGSANDALKARTFVKTTVTQLPHVEIDINTTTEAILEVPFVSAYPYFPLGGFTATNFTLGVVGLYPYSPLATAGGSTVADYTIYTSYKDVQLVGPTVPQMAFKRVASNNSKTPQEVEQSQQGLGPVSGIAKTVSVVASTLGSKIPALSKLAAPVTWAADIVGGIASIFGWSNPLDLSEVTRAVQTIMPFQNNCDMPDASMPLSLFARNQLEIVPGFAGNDIDEMSIDYIKTIPAYLTSFTFSTANNVGDQLYLLNVAPNSFSNSFTDGVVAFVTSHTPISFLTNLFNFWRGGIRITFKIVKTEFHSGRLSVAFIPQEPLGVNGIAPATSTPEGRMYTHREIIDIREGNQFDFIIPYESILPWRDFTDVVGTLQVYVINPLVAPATVPSSITFLVEVAGAEDFAVAFPRNHTLQPIIPSAPQMAFNPKKNDNAIVTDEIGNSTTQTESHIEARACVGEQIKSLLSLLKSADNYLFPTMGANLQISLDPFALPISRSNGVTVSQPQDNTYIDNLGLISSCFLFQRGGVRIRAIPTTGTGYSMAPITGRLLDTHDTTSNYTGYTLAATATPMRHPLDVVQNLAFRGGLEVQVPSYQLTHSRSVYSMMYEPSGTIANVYGTRTTSRTKLLISVIDTQPLFIKRQAADDFQLGFFLGIMPTRILF